jgi:hypothetical protein
MRVNTMKPNAKRISNQSPESMLKMMSKIISAGNIKVANKYCNRNLISMPTNNTNYTNKPIGA